MIFLQPLRLLKFSRLAKLLRGARAARAFALVGKGARHSRTRVTIALIPWILAVSGVLVLLAAALVWGIERQVEAATIKTFGNALWWAVATAATSGTRYEPVTTEGRTVAVGLMLLGITVVAGIAGIFASDFIRRRPEDAD